MRILSTLALALTLLYLTACWHSRQQIYCDLTNQSGLTLNAIEVDYPGATYGIPQLKPGDTHRKWLAVTPPCKFSLHFEDAKGKQYQSKPIDFGKEKCPSEVVLTIDPQMNVTGVPK